MKQFQNDAIVEVESILPEIGQGQLDHVHPPNAVTTLAVTAAPAAPAFSKDAFAVQEHTEETRISSNTIDLRVSERYLACQAPCTHAV